MIFPTPMVVDSILSKIDACTAKTAVEALQTIAIAAEPFVSCGNDCGTHNKELAGPVAYRTLVSEGFGAR